MDALTKFLDRLSSFLDIIDLAYLVSGACCVMSLALFIPSVRNIAQQVTSVQIGVMAIFASYVFGLICFIIGRWLRTRTDFKHKLEQFDIKFTKAIFAHGLDKDPCYAQYLARSEYRGVWNLNARFWSEVRANKDSREMYNYLERIWSKAAIYDGLYAFIILFLALFDGTAFNSAIMVGLDRWIVILLVNGLLLLTMYIVRHRAAVSEDYVIEELVATVAVLREKAKAEIECA